MRPRCFHRPVPPSARRGFTLVEVLVAIVLIEVGLLALSASSAIVVREALLARARVAALETSRNRVETLAASPCAATSGSVSVGSGLRDDWSTQLVPGSAREIRDSVTVTVQGRTRAVVLRTRTPCAP